MAIELEMTGSGSVGELGTGWTVNEYSTPAISGNRAGGVGGVALSAKKNDDTAFIINNESVFTEDRLGTVSGLIKGVNLSGISASFSQTSDLAIFDAEEELPGLISGGVHQTVDLLTQIVKKDIRLKDGLPGGFWSLAGHNAGFDSLGNLLQYKEYQTPYSWVGSGGQQNFNVNTCKDALWVASQDHQYKFGKLFADFVRGDTIISDVDKPYYGVSFKSYINSATGYLEWAVDGFPLDSVTNTDREVSVKVNRSTQTIDIYVVYRAGGVVTTINNSYPVNVAIDMSQELAVFVNYNLTSASAGAYGYEIVVSVCNTSDYSVYTTVTQAFTADAMPLYYNQWFLSAYGPGSQGYRSVWVTENYADLPIEDWENQPSYSLSNDVITDDIISRSVVGGKYNMWQFLQDACSSHGQEVLVSNGDILIRKNGEYVFDITNVVASPSLNIETILSSESVDIVYTNCVSTTEFTGLTVDARDEVYSAYDDKNRIISVEPNQVVETTVKTKNYLLSVLPTYKSSLFVNQAGAYAVCDSTGANVTNDAWKAYGGSVTGTINPDDKTAIDIKVIGPTVEIPGKTSPYSIAYSSGEEKYAALSFTGTALITSEETLTLQTGAPENKTAQKNAATVKNPHVGSIGKAYTTGVWVSSYSGGPRATFSGTIPTSSINGFGFTAGALFRYEDAIYRVDSAAISNIGVSINASLYTNLDDFDGLWSSKTVEFHDDLWYGNEIQDQIVKPLWKVTLSGVYLTIDTDGATTWTDERYGEATFAFDTDGVPYLINSGDDEDNTLIYLDSDFTPYYV